MYKLVCGAASLYATAISSPVNKTFLAWKPRKQLSKRLASNFSPPNDRTHHESSLMKFINSISLALALSSLMGCATQTPSVAAPTYVLVHGAFQDARAWADVTPLLQARGVKAIAVNLPGRASDGSAPEAATLDGHRDHVAAIVAAQPGAVVLVGHSFGGITISAVAQKMPEKIVSLVYVAAYLPQAGAADQSMAKLAETDQWSQFNKKRQNFILAADYKTASVLSEDQIMLFCAECSAEAQKKTLAIMQREPLKPAATPVTLSAERFGKVDKVYVHTTRDKAVSYELQQQMVARTPVRKTLSLNTGHSPFVQAPQALVDALLNLR
jgi:pimeloyl-ACP methyl ester carboxylesterase